MIPGKIRDSMTMRITPVFEHAHDVQATGPGRCPCQQEDQDRCRRLVCNRGGLWPGHWQDLWVAGGHGVDWCHQGFEAMGQKKHDHKNAKRDLERKLLKGSAWPKPYEMRLPAWSLAQQQEVFFLLFWGGGGWLGGSCIMSGNFI